MTEKRYVCKNAICKYGGLFSERTKEFLAKRQYPKGSSFVFKDDLESIGDSIDIDFKESSLDERVIVRMPTFERRLF